MTIHLSKRILVALLLLVVCFAAAAWGGAAFAGPNGSDPFSQILNAVGAIQAKTNNLPADPVGLSDLNQVQSNLNQDEQNLLESLPVSGAITRTLLGSGCVALPPASAYNRERALTITLESMNSDGSVAVDIYNSLSALSSYTVDLKANIPTTFVESETGGFEHLNICSELGSDTFVSAIWLEGPAT
jgi:hypothetical protein